MPVSVIERHVYVAATYTVTFRFYANGGGTVPPNESVSTSSNSSTVQVGKNISATVPTREGYDFIGYKYNSASGPWSASPGGYVAQSFTRNETMTTERTYTDGGMTVHETTHYAANQTSYVNLYAQWRVKTYTVNFDANGGTGAPAAQTKTHGTALTLSATVPTRPEYVFDGWATSPGGAVAYLPGASYTANANVTLYAVWHLAGAQLTSITSPVEVGSTGTASWTSFGPTFTYKLELTCGDAPPVTVTKGAGETSATFTIPNTWLSAISGSTSGTGTATLTTYDGTTPLGSTQMSFVVNVPSTVKPTIDSFTVTPYSTNATVTSWGEFVQGFTKADLAVSASAGTGASIASIAFSGPGINQTGEATTGRSEIINAPGTATFTVTVVDSRGRSETATASVTVYPYAAPVVISIGTMRADADGTTNNASGDYLKVTPVYSLSSVNGHNNFTAQTLSYYEHGSSTPQASGTCVSGHTYGPPVNLWPINLSDAYDIVVELTDALGSSVGGAVTLPGAGGLWYDGDNTLGLGMVPSTPGLHVDWKSFFYDDVTFYGNVSGIPAPTGFVPEAGADGFLVRSNNSVGAKEFMKSLWSDAAGWNSGQKTISGLSGYNVFAVRLDGVHSLAIGMLGIGSLNTTPTYLRATGGWASSSGYGDVYASFTRSGDDLTFEAACTVNQAGTRTDKKVIEIIGVM